MSIASFFRQVIPYHWRLRYRMNKAVRAFNDLRTTWPIEGTAEQRAAAEKKLFQLRTLKRASTRDYLTNELHRLNIPVPQQYDPEDPNSTNDYYDGRDFLTEDGERQFQTWVAERKKTRREQLQHFLAIVIGVIGAITGAIGATIGLVTTLHPAHTGSSPTSPAFIVLVTNPTPTFTTTPTATPMPPPTLTPTGIVRHDT